jgi:thiamine kinase-like enzyme
MFVEISQNIYVKVDINERRYINILEQLKTNFSSVIGCAGSLKSFNQYLKAPPERILLDDIDEAIEALIGSRYYSNYFGIAFDTRTVHHFYENAYYLCEKFVRYNLFSISIFPYFISNQGIKSRFCEGANSIPRNKEQIESYPFEEVWNCIESYQSGTEVLKSAELYLNHTIGRIEIELEKLQITHKRLVWDIYTTIYKNIKKIQLKELMIRCALTHGDLKFEHIFVQNTKITSIIDWETLGVRSKYFDYYNLILPWMSHQHSPASSTLFDTRLRELTSTHKHFKHFYEDRDAEYIYLQFYLLERLLRIFENKNSGYDKQNGINRFIKLSKFIGEFYREQKNW